MTIKAMSAPFSCRRSLLWRSTTIFCSSRLRISAPRRDRVLDDCFSSSARAVTVIIIIVVTMIVSSSSASSVRLMLNGWIEPSYSSTPLRRKAECYKAVMVMGDAWPPIDYITCSFWLFRQKNKMLSGCFDVSTAFYYLATERRVSMTSHRPTAVSLVIGCYSN